MPDTQNIVEFNVKNVKYALKNSSGYSTPKDFTSACTIGLESETNTKEIYGDGEVIMTSSNEISKNVSLEVNIECLEFEKDMGRKLVTSAGVADTAQTVDNRFALYFETEAKTPAGATVVIKTWLLNVSSMARPTKSLQQNTTEINNQTQTYEFKTYGQNLKKSTGTEDFVDANGNPVRLFQVSVQPSDSGYSTFGASVPSVKSTN